MKKFFYSSIMALCLVACGVTPPEDTPIFTLKYYNADGQLVDLYGGQTIEISKFDVVEGDEAPKLLFEGVLYCEESFNLEVKATRYHYENTSDEFCLGQCVPGNGEAMQVFSASINQDETDFYAHFGANKSGDYKIDYDFYEKEKPNVKISITVIYKYYPEN